MTGKIDTAQQPIGRFAQWVRRTAPEGLALPDPVWASRHQAIVRILFLHAAGLFVFAVVRGFSPIHGLLEASPIALFALAARDRRFSRLARSLAGTAGLVTASAILVHLSGGTIEAHFHFFVMLGLISLYQSWRPFLFALAYVVLHHGIMGAIDASSVYNHVAAWNDPWTWAAIHGVFVLAASAAQLATWRFSEAARRHSELMLESAGSGMVGIDLDGRVTFMNRGAADILGIDRDTAIGAPAHDVLAPSDARREPIGATDWPVAMTIETGEAQQSSDMWFTPSDRAIPVDLISTPIVQRGELIGAMLSFRDRTEYRAALAELDTAASLLSATLESTADGILVVDLEGKIRSFNEKFVQMWQIPSEIIESGDDDRAIGFVLDQLSDPDGFVRKVRELYSLPEATSEDILEFKDGRVFERYSQPQRVDGRCVGRVWSFRDITQQRRLDEMKDSFLTAVSHELRTPLTSVVGFASTLRSHDDRLTGAERNDILDRLNENAAKLRKLLTDILDLDRLGRGMLEPHRRPTDLREVIATAIHETSADHRPLTVNVTDGMFMLDTAKVERIIENLLSNAIRHTPDDARIWVRCAAEDGRVTIAVEDDGPGVPEHLRATVLEPFAQGPSLRTHSPGVGVGLSLVTRFAQLMGGTVSVGERVGGGASFVVMLEAERVDVESNGSQPSAHERSSAP